MKNKWIMDAEILKEKSREFREHEGRASFYDMALEIVDQYPLQASIIILATWNVSRFRFMVSNSENIANFVKAMDKCIPLFERIKNYSFQSTNFDEIKEIIEYIYLILSAVKGVEYTGASKVMHLLNKNLFVMWDGYIRDEYECGDTGEDYVDFLKQMQEKFKDIEWNMPGKTLTKAIDEYNYVTITLPALEKNRKRKKAHRLP